RWFLEQHQGLKDSDLRIQPFRVCVTYKSNKVEGSPQEPSERYMDFIHDVLPSKPQAPALSKAEANRSWQLSNISGKTKSITDIAFASQESFSLVNKQLDDLLLKLRAMSTGSEPIENPMFATYSKGRFRNKRIVGQYERNVKRQKKSPNSKE
ncbi:hypothetical protein BGX34_011394, partial [Mortierella sp. NVP85]